MTKKQSFIKKISGALAAHKVLTTVIVVTCLIGGYGIYNSAKKASLLPQYVLSTARIGTITKTVTGTGQISASNQTDVKSLVSGTILSIKGKVGQHVKKGDLIATIDSTSAAIDLQNARISLAKLTQPAKITDISNATNNLNAAYNDAFNATASIFLDLPPVMSGMKDLLYSTTGFLSDQTSTYLGITARSYRQTAATNYDLAINSYAATLEEFKGMTRASATSSLEKLFADTYAMIKTVSTAVQNAQSTITFISASQPDYNTKNAVTAAANVTSWGAKVNSDLANLLSSVNSIQTSKNSITTLQEGTDPLDVEAQRLSLQQKQQTYDNYFIRAPFDGVIGRIPVNVYDQAGNGTIMATVVGEQKVSTISLNEVDASKVQQGQSVNLLFDAIDGLNATGTVSQVDLVGTVNQGVVSYNVKIVVNTDDARIKPGMSVNASIITKQISDVLIVPTVAIKKVAGVSTVQVFDSPFGSTTPRNQFASTTAYASSTLLASTTPRMNGGQRTITISSATAPKQVTVSTGEFDDTNTEITSGLDRGQLVVTRTIAAGTTQSTAPNILSSISQRGGASGARPAGGAAPR